MSRSLPLALPILGILSCCAAGGESDERQSAKAQAAEEVRPT